MSRFLVFQMHNERFDCFVDLDDDTTVPDGARINLIALTSFEDTPTDPAESSPTSSGAWESGASASGSIGSSAVNCGASGSGSIGSGASGRCATGCGAVNCGASASDSIGSGASGSCATGCGAVNCGASGTGAVRVSQQRDFLVPKMPLHIYAHLNRVKRGDVPDDVRSKVIDWIFYTISTGTLYPRSYSEVASALVAVYPELRDFSDTGYICIFCA
ncbi:uncharacterized protein LOC144148084 [Haemaphysalis longicornis]